MQPHPERRPLVVVAQEVDIAVVVAGVGELAAHDEQGAPVGDGHGPDLNRL